MGAFEDAVADAVLSKYDSLPKHSKPDVDGRGIRNWVPLSGIVIEHKDGTLECISMAWASMCRSQRHSLTFTSTGMKCLPAAQVASANGIVLHDCHAEVLAIRLFNLFLLRECQSLLRSDIPSRYVRRRESTELTDDSSQPCTLREELRLHMYCSEAPCGDASMELTMSAQEDATPWPVSKHVADGAEPARLRGRGFFSELGVVRCKPGRADSPITWSKSCSDKLALKQATSLLSSLTAAIISPERAYLHSLIIPESQHVPEACQRCFASDGRLKSIAGSAWPGAYAFRPFEVRSTMREFAMSRRQCSGPEPTPKASNKSVLWTPHVYQIVINGVLHGRKQTDIRGASAVARRTLGSRVQAMTLAPGLEMLKPIAVAETYGEAKSADLLSARGRVKQSVLQAAFPGWILNVADDFRLDRVEHDGSLERLHETQSRD